MAQLPIIIILSQLLLLGLVRGNTFDLSQLQWTLRNQNGSIQIPASGPPSQTHLDLLKAGIITEPLLGINGTCVDCICEITA